MAQRHGWPVLADPLSGAHVSHPSVVTTFDALTRDPQLRAALAPQVVVALGAPPASRSLSEALAEWQPRLLAVDERAWPGDPLGLVTEVLVASPDAMGARGDAGRAPRWPCSDFLSAWRAADDAATAVFD